MGPYNVTVDPETIGTDYFSVRWEGPKDLSVFDRYQVAIGIRRKSPQIIERGQQLVATFNDDILPGRTYEVIVKTVSGSVASWPMGVNVTTKPLPVRNLEEEVDPETLEVRLTWQADPESQQDSFKIEYHELETFNGDSSSVVVNETFFSMEQLKPGRNYSIAVRSVSNGMESVERTVYHATRPSEPIIEAVKPKDGDLDKSWVTDETSKQEKYIVVYPRPLSVNSPPSFNLVSHFGGGLVYNKIPTYGYTYPIIY